ncbi:MAG: DNA primase [Candidatus Margulisbacteria bacterium]|jgi:DNA primase|nr:DNA primase [Candidatus Margulisiibacteriota bacterium]
MIDPKTIEEIKLKSDIVTVIGRYVPLKQKGNNFWGLCPFHKEKTPSFAVSKDKGIFRCFGCGKSGNVFSFIREVEHVDFVQAVRLLGEQCGVTIAEVQGEHYEQNKILYQINEAAEKFFQEQLWRSDRAQNYLRERRLTRETAQLFGLGYAPEGWTSLLAHLQNQFAPEKIAAAGLVVRKDNGEYLDRFHKRLMFPIKNAQGKTLAFSGRIVEREDAAKYVNSPETPIFFKGHNLYGLHLAKKAITEQNKAVLVEGQMDVVACHAAGFSNAVASLGTAFTADQARLLGKYSKNVVIAYDKDEAGLNATDKTIEVLTALNFQTRILAIPVKDPDEMIQKHGAAALKQALADAGDFVQYKLTRVLRKYDLQDRLQKAQAARESLQVLDALPDRVLASEYLKWLSQQTGIGVEILRENQNERKIQAFGYVPKKYVPPAPKDKYARAEEGLFAAMLSDLELRGRFFARFQLEDLAENWRPALRYLQQNCFVDDRLLEDLEAKPELGEVKELISRVLVEPGRLSGAECFRMLEQKKTNETKQKLRGELAAAETTGDEVKAAEILRQLQQIRIGSVET